MTPETIPLSFTPDGWPSFLVKVDSRDEASITGTVEEVNSWAPDDGKPHETDLYLSFMIKWDGCSHINFGKENGYLHLCGEHFWSLHCKLMTWLFAWAKKEIPMDETICH